MITMDAFSAYKIYMGLKAHFNSDYDFKKYSGKTTASKSSYLKRKDKFFFGKVSRRYGEKVNAVNPLKNEITEVEIHSPHFYDPEGELLRG